MQIKELIAHLQNIEDLYGNIHCFTNGEHGTEEQLILEATHVSANVGIVELTEDMQEHVVETGMGDLTETKYLHIGGY